MCEVKRRIPDPVKRRLRQESGFGCCVCGHPFLEYHHIIPFSVRAHHEPENMIALCPNHHHQADQGALSEGEQREHKTRPYNVLNDIAEGDLKYNYPYVATILGGTEFVGPGIKIAVDKEPLIQILKGDDDQLLLSITLYDENDNVLFIVQGNEWISGDQAPWDIDYKYKHITIRSAPKNISLTIDAKRFPIKVTGKLWRKKRLFELGKKEIKIDRKNINFTTSRICYVNSSIEFTTSTNSLTISPSPPIGEQSLVAGPTSDIRLIKGIFKYAELAEKHRVEI